MRDHQINILTDGEPQASRRVGAGIRPASCLCTESLGSGGIFLGRAGPRSVDVGIELDGGEGRHQEIWHPDGEFCPLQFTFFTEIRRYPHSKRRKNVVRETPVTESPGIWCDERLLALSPDASGRAYTLAALPAPPCPAAGTDTGLPYLSIKNDSLNPTGSLKDRASAVALARAAELGAKRVAVASTGNAGSSLAGLAAAMGIPAAIFVPASAPRAKLVQGLTYGAEVFAVQGSYDDAFEFCLQACDHFGWYNSNSLDENLGSLSTRRATKPYSENPSAQEQTVDGESAI